MPRPIGMQREVLWLDSNFPELSSTRSSHGASHRMHALKVLKNRKPRFCSKFKADKYHVTKKLDLWNSWLVIVLISFWEKNDKCSRDCHRHSPVTEHHCLTE